MIILFLLIFSSLFAADRKYHATAYERHLLKCDHGLNKDCNLWRDNYLTGDWYGERARLAEKGYTFTFQYVADFNGNASGGLHKGFAFAGSFGADFAVDLEKTSNFSGWSTYASFVWRLGTNLSERKIGNIFNVAQVFGGESWKLNNLYVMKKAFNNRLMFKVGRLEGGNNFLQSPLYYYFTSNAFDGNPVGIFINTPFFAYPVSAWGAYLEFRPFSRRFRMQYGIYNANSRVHKNKYHGFNFTFSTSNQGVMLNTEWIYLKSQEKGDTGLPGNYKVGALYITGKNVESFRPNVHGNYLWYLLFDQMIYRFGPHGSDRGIHPFIALLFCPKNQNRLPFYMTAGIVTKGFSQYHEEDSFNIGVALGKFSSDLRKKQRRNNEEPLYYELDLEINYRWNISPWFYIQPDFIYIIKPGGGNIPNAWVFGSQVSVTF